MDSRVMVNKRPKNQGRDELKGLSKHDLIDKVIQLQAHNIQLRNILQKKLAEETDVHSAESLKESSNPKKNKRKFDFSKCHKRHVLLKFLYFGWDYHGLACQEDTNATIEYHLFSALSKVCLIDSRASSNYHRCGRTDKEVSAFCQVISIDLRSKFPKEVQLTEDGIQNEIDYCGLLNRVLPKNIQCIAWMPLRSNEYSARFDCQSRAYRYYFPRGNLNIEAMRQCCELLTTCADFRNFCKMDVNNGVMNYKRQIYSATIQEFNNQTEDGGYKMCYLEICANSFLWHQIRCIMAILLLIGQEKEDASVITELLNVECNPCKPQYTPAAALPLNLFQCEFRPISEKTIKNIDESQADMTSTADSDTTDWVYKKENLEKLIETVQCEWTQYSIKTVMIRDVLHSLENLMKQHYKGEQINSQVNALQEHTRAKQYQKLMTRKRCESLDSRVEHFVKKQRLILKNTSS